MEARLIITILFCIFFYLAVTDFLFYSLKNMFLYRIDIYFVIFFLAVVALLDQCQELRVARLRLV